MKTLQANKQMKRWSTSQIIREMKIKFTTNYHLIPVRIVYHSKNISSGG
jgi:hypothetical protein